MLPRQMVQMDPALVECDSEAIEENHHELLVSDSCGENHGSVVQWQNY